MIDVADVIAGIRVTDVLDTYVGLYRARREIRLVECPKCRARPRRRSVVVNGETGQWIHHGGGEGCSGDVLDLVAAFEGLNRKRDFRKLLDIAAPLAGVLPGMGDVERERRRHERRAELEAYERTCREKESTALAAVPGRWAALASRHVIGEAYLLSRGIVPAELVARDIVRFASNGDPVVRLFDLETGEPVNLITRHIRGERKVDALEWCSTDGSLIGRVKDIDPDGADVAVLCEGMTDGLAAVLAFPGCVVLGANGAGHLQLIAEAAAKRLAAIRGWLLIVPDVDDVGVAHAARATEAAIAAGLVLDQSIRLVDVRPEKDLAEAWRSGWHWSWT